MASVVPNTEITYPSQPQTIEETGLELGFLCDLTLKVLNVRGTISGLNLANHLRLPFPIVNIVLKELMKEPYCSRQGMNTLESKDDDAKYENLPLEARLDFSLSDKGRERAESLTRSNQYSGAAPVPLSEYISFAEGQKKSYVQPNRRQLEDSLSHLVLSDTFFNHLGPALCARQTLFLYGPPGNGKTSIAEACAGIMGPPFFIPKALYVNGEIIRFFDPIQHKELEYKLPTHDERWVLVERPIVKVGGELKPAQLELGYDSSVGFYEAPLQLKANGGIFLIDDFGRQQDISPQHLLNRLIVPLEKGVDYLNLIKSGTSLFVPFTGLLIMSTNLKPKELIDEAFLRRVRYKVEIPNPTRAEFKEIWKLACGKHHLEIDEKLITYILERYKAEGREFRGVHPRDLVSHIVNAASYNETPAKIDKDSIKLAFSTYFLSSE